MLRATPILLFILCYLVPTQGHAQSSNIPAALPAILCLLLCDEEVDDSVPPELVDIGGTTNVAQGGAITPITFTNNGGILITSCSVAPPLPSGLSAQVSADQRSCEIVGTPTTPSPLTSYTITAENMSGTDQASINLAVVAMLSVSGKVEFERVPTATGPTRLDYNNITAMPVRQASVELLDAGSNVISTTTTDANGGYSFAVDPDQPVRVRVRAELLKTGGSGQYDVKVVDNTNSDALYTLAEASSTLASANPVRNLLAGSGWGGSSYTTTRASAPFAMLDSILGAMEDFIAVDPAIVFPPLEVKWSINNVPVFGNESIGQIGTSFYRGGDIFILGAENNDTDEFDDHIIVHEWGHYFEDNISRSDSVGGPHGGADRLDMRVAFGEGFGNALSGIITDDPLYIDTSGVSQNNGFVINVESNSVTNPGWYNESSVQAILYDLYDSNADGNDTLSMGLGPLYDVLIDQQKTTDVFTSIFSFITAIKDDNPGLVAGIDQLVNAQSIVGTGMDRLGSSETNNAGAANVLPVYTAVTVDAGPVNVCTLTNFNNGNDRNKLSNTRFLTFVTPSFGSYTITVSKTSTTYPSMETDPDFIVRENGVLRINSDSGTVDVEVATANLNAGTHAMALLDWNVAFNTATNHTSCFDVSVSVTP